MGLFSFFKPKGHNVDRTDPVDADAIRRTEEEDEKLKDKNTLEAYQKGEANDEIASRQQGRADVRTENINNNAKRAALQELQNIVNELSQKGGLDADAMQTIGKANRDDATVETIYDCIEYLKTKSNGMSR